MFELKQDINEALYNIKQILKDETNKNKQQSINTIVNNTIKTIKESNSAYKKEALKDFITEAQRLIVFTDYNLDEVITLNNIQ